MKKKTLIYLVIGLTLLFGVGVGGCYWYRWQQARSLYHQEQTAYRQKNYSLALEFCRKITPGQLRMLSELEQANTLIHAGHCLYEMNRYSDCIDYFARAAEIVEKNDLLTQIEAPTQLYNRWGESYEGEKQYTQAEKIYRRGLKMIGTELGESYSGVALMQSRLGQIYFHEANYPASLTHFEMALKNETFIKHQEIADLAGFYGEMAAAYCHNNRLSEALVFYEKSIIYTQQTYGNDSARIGVEYAGKALVFFRQGKTLEAIKLLDLAYSILEKKCGKDYRATRRIAKLREEWQTKLNEKK